MRQMTAAIEFEVAQDSREQEGKARLIMLTSMLCDEPSRSERGAGKGKWP